MKFANFYSELNFLGKMLPSKFKMRSSEVAQKTQPFFVVSAGRSGSTLLASLLGKHTKVSMPTEQFVLPQAIVKFNLFNWMQWEDVSAIICTEFIRTKGNQNWQLEARELIDSAHSLPKSERNLWNLIDLAFRSYSKSRGEEKAIWGDKTPSNHEHIDIVQSLFKEAKYIFLIRDGRDVINSYLRKEDEPDDPQFGVDEWNRSIQKMDSIRGKLKSDQILDLKYEDLVSNPEEVFQEISQFLNIPFEPVHLESGSGYLNQMGDVGKMEAMTNVNRPINLSSIGKWERELDPKILESVMPKIQKGLERFGYL